MVSFGLADFSYRCHSDYINRIHKQKEKLRERLVQIKLDRGKASRRERESHSKVYIIDDCIISAQRTSDRFCRAAPRAIKIVCEKVNVLRGSHVKKTESAKVV